MGQGSILHEVLNSGQSWATERATIALQVQEALAGGLMSQDEAREVLSDLVATEKLDAEATDVQLRATLVFGITQLISLC